MKKALLIGINDYGRDSGLASLKYAESDAHAMAEVLKKRCGFFTTVLTGANATRDAIEQELFRCEKGDTFLFYFSGHGQIVDAHYSLHPAGSNVSGRGAMPFSSLYHRWQSDFGFRNVVAILDSCRNEMGGVRGCGVFDDLSSREMTKAVQGTRWVEVLYGCSEGQCSYEFEGLGHGLLTYSLLEVLQTYSGVIDSAILAGMAGDLMRAWCAQDTLGHRQEAHRYAKTTLSDRIILADAIVGSASSGGAESVQENVFKSIRHELISPAVTPVPLTEFPLHNIWVRELGITGMPIKFCGRQVALSAFDQDKWMAFLRREIADERAPSLCIGFHPQNVTLWRAGFKKGVDIECALSIYNPKNRWDARVSLGVALVDENYSICVSGMLDPLRVDQVEHLSMKRGANVLSNYNGIEDLIVIMPFGFDLPRRLAMDHKDERQYQLVFTATGEDGVIGFCHSKLFFRMGLRGNKVRFL